MEQWWNDTDRGKLKYWEKDIILHIVSYILLLSKLLCYLTEYRYIHYMLCIIVLTQRKWRTLR